MLANTNKASLGVSLRWNEYALRVSLTLLRQAPEPCHVESDEHGKPDPLPRGVFERSAMSHLSLKRIAIALSALVLLMTRAVYGSHLPPITPVLPGEDHRHEDHSGADFSFDDLSDVNFSEGNFTETLFEDARLDRVLFIGATLDRALLRTQFTDGANFTGASLVNAELRGMGGTGVVFADADLSGVEMDDSFFHFSDFRNVNFAGADLGEFTAEDSDFRGADLSSAVNIDSLFFRSVYDSSTRFPPGYDPQGAGMIFVPEPATANLLSAGLIFTGFLRAALRRKSI
jgi:Pentapeptide repeats (8 copies)